MSAIRKLAILVLAHKDVFQLNRLLSSLEHPDIDVYVHVDAKQDDFLGKTLGLDEQLFCLKMNPVA